MRRFALPEHLLILFLPRFDRGDMSFIIICGALVLFMVPGVGTCLRYLCAQKALTLSPPPFREPIPACSLPLFRPVETEKCSASHLDSHREQRRRHLPMVLLGLLARLLLNSHQRVHRQST